MEVDLLDGQAMCLRLGICDDVEDAMRARPSARREVGGIDEGRDVGRRAMLVVVMMVRMAMIVIVGMGMVMVMVMGIIMKTILIMSMRKNTDTVMITTTGMTMGMNIIMTMRIIIMTMRIIITHPCVASKESSTACLSVTG